MRQGGVSMLTSDYKQTVSLQSAYDVRSLFEFHITKILDVSLI